jgi:D-threo-aldose 1-dehydrogenase
VDVRLRSSMVCRYGRGQSEHRLGRFLYDIKPRQGFTLSTKVGRVLHRPTWRDRQSPYPPSNPALAGWQYQASAWGIPEGVSAALEFDHRHDYSYDGIMRRYRRS